MEEPEPFGVIVARYQGLGHVTEKDGGTTPVYFDARQVEGGEIVVRCIAQVPGLGLDPIAVEGHTTDGRAFACTGELHRIGGSFGGALSRLEILASRMRARSLGSDDKAVYYLRAALLNVRFGPIDKPPVGPMNLRVRDYSVTFTPVPEYERLSNRLRRGGGLAHTAWCEFHRPGREPLDLADVESVLDEILDPLSFALGTDVNWLHYEALDIGRKSVGTVHRNSVVRSYANETQALRWAVNPLELVDSWFRPDDADRERRRQLAIWSSQYLEACAPNLYLETRALTAATLLDILAFTHADRTGTHLICAASEWGAIVKRVVRPTLDGVPSLGSEQKQQLLDNITGVFRRSFPRKLRALLMHLNISVEK